MAKWRHASCSTSRGAEAKEGLWMGQPSTAFRIEVVRPSDDLGRRGGAHFGNCTMLRQNLRQSEQF